MQIVELILGGLWRLVIHGVYLVESFPILVVIYDWVALALRHTCVVLVVLLLVVVLMLFLVDCFRGAHQEQGYNTG